MVPSSVYPAVLLLLLTVHLAEAARPGFNLKLHRLREIRRPLNIDNDDSGSVPKSVITSTSTSTSTSTPSAAAAATPRPGAKDCATRWIAQDLDHFSWQSPAPGGGLDTLNSVDPQA
jgi:hypothetical protein